MQEKFQEENDPSNRTAVLSMDVEDWYHLDYLASHDLDRSTSMMDGLDRYAVLLKAEDIKTTFFVVGSFAESIKSQLRDLVSEGHDIACHGWGHARPMTLSIDEFREDLKRAKGTIEDVVGTSVVGYRAPCFSLDRARLDIVRELDFRYSSSKINVKEHPLYGSLDVSDSMLLCPYVYSLDGFLEFEVSTLPFAGRKIPVSGGGYIRMFPWILMACLIRRYLSTGLPYILYTHPFELSARHHPKLPSTVKRSSQVRFSLGLGVVEEKIRKLIGLLRQGGYSFTTFRDWREALLSYPQVPEA